MRTGSGTAAKRCKHFLASSRAHSESRRLASFESHIVKNFGGLMTFILHLAEDWQRPYGQETR
jgi:hypothetical protein